MKNQPDSFEKAEMDKMNDPAFPRDGQQIVSAVDEDGSYVRVLLPLFYEKACLSCHGTPKGERDITGYPRHQRQNPAKPYGVPADGGSAASLTLTGHPSLLLRCVNE